MRLVVVDDHPVVLTGLDQLFAMMENVNVVARCRTGTEALDAVRTSAPDVVVLDLRLPDISGLDVLRTLKQEQTRARIVLLSAVASAEDVEAARRLGADGFLYKDLSPSSLVDGVLRAAQGLRPFPPQLADAADACGARFEQLTSREREVVAAVASARRNRAIAERLGITEGTVKLHLHNIYEKLGVDGRFELLLLARRAGLSA